MRICNIIFPELNTVINLEIPLTVKKKNDLGHLTPNN